MFAKNVVCRVVFPARETGEYRVELIFRWPIKRNRQSRDHEIARKHEISKLTIRLLESPIDLPFFAIVFKDRAVSLT